MISKLILSAGFGAMIFLLTENYISARSSLASQAGRLELNCSIAELPADPDGWTRDYNAVRTHQGRCCYGKTPMQTLLDVLPAAKEKLLQAT